MDYLLIGIGLIVLMLAFAGCFLPVLPGPPLGYVALLLLQVTSEPPFSLSFMVGMGIGAAVVTALDFFIPPLATRKYGGTRYGVWGSILGLVAGMFILPPWGILVFPFAGAYLGERYFGPQKELAGKAAFGAAMGQLSGILLKLIFVMLTTYYFFSGAPWV